MEYQGCLASRKNLKDFYPYSQSYHVNIEVSETSHYNNLTGYNTHITKNQPQ